MEYRSQLVVRTRDPREARIIEKVKEIADGRGASISEVALELLERAIHGEPPIDVQRSDSGGARSEPPVEATSDKKGPTPRPLLSLLTQALDDTPRIVVLRACEHLDAEGRAAAARFLAEFYESASAVDGGRVRVALSNALAPAEYDALHDALRETDEYRSYTRRVVDSH